MKKFAKISSITAGILLTLGIMLCAISVIAGGERLIRNIAKDVYIGRWGGRLGSFVSRIVYDVAGSEIASYLTEDISSGLVEIPTDLNINGKKAGKTGTDSVLQADQIHGLEMSLGAGEFLLETRDDLDGQISLSIKGVGNCDYYVSNGILYVEGFKNVKLFGNNKIGEMTVSIPADLTLNELSVVLGAGELTIKNLVTQGFEAEVGAGVINAKNVYAQDADITVGMGEITFTGGIAGNLDAECSMGNLEMTLEGVQEAHNFDIECSAGNLEMDGFSITGLSAKRYIDNHADSTYEITCDLGNITIRFKD